MGCTPDEREIWLNATEDEISSLNELGAWVLDDVPQSQPLPTHVVLRIKRKKEATIERFKARIVAGGTHQIFGEKYLEAYDPVVNFSVVRIFLYLSMAKDIFKVQLDIKTANLNAVWEENIWAMSPRGILRRPSRCYRLLKAVYRLKQAHSNRHKFLCGVLVRLRLFELPSASCVFAMNW